MKSEAITSFKQALEILAAVAGVTKGAIRARLLWSKSTSIPPVPRGTTPGSRVCEAAKYLAARCEISPEEVLAIALQKKRAPDGKREKPSLSGKEGAAIASSYTTVGAAAKRAGAALPCASRKERCDDAQRQSLNAGPGAPSMIERWRWRQKPARQA